MARVSSVITILILSLTSYGVYHSCCKSSNLQTLMDFVVSKAGIGRAGVNVLL